MAVLDLAEFYLILLTLNTNAIISVHSQIFINTLMPQSQWLEMPPA